MQEGNCAPGDGDHPTVSAFLTCRLGVPTGKQKPNLPSLGQRHPDTGAPTWEQGMGSNRWRGSNTHPQGTQSHSCSECTAEALGCSFRSGCPCEQLFPGQGDFKISLCTGERWPISSRKCCKEDGCQMERAMGCSGVDSSSSIDSFGKFQPFQDPSSPCQKTAVYGLMSEVCYAPRREMGQLSASALPPVQSWALMENGM